MRRSADKGEDPPGRATALGLRTARLRAEMRRWSPHPGQLVIVDEASLAGTFALDELVSQARDAGAKVLLVGDWAQLSAVEAGGAFDLLVRDRGDLVPELAEVRRFRSGWERGASVRLRVGDESAIRTYADHDRIASGGRDVLLDRLYAAWKADVDAGKTSLMIAGDRDTVAELNRRARADRVAAGQARESASGAGVSGARVGVGDRVITRQNDRRLSTGRRWVKNGDRWDVTAVFADGSLAVKRAGGGGEVVLPAEYAREHVDLGYAVTAHAAQGATVDTAHTLVSPTTTREVLYVGVTRGRENNMLYVDTEYDPDPETNHDHASSGADYETVLRAVLANVGADASAHETIRREREADQSLPRLVAEYLSIARDADRDR